MVRKPYFKEPAEIKQSEDENLEYAESIINTVREPLIVLDVDLTVLRANLSFYTVFKVKPEKTVGQHIYDLGDKQWDIPKLREFLENIIPQKMTFDDYEVEHDFPTLGRRIMLLNARQIQRKDGKRKIMLLSIADITDLRQAEKVLAEKSENALLRSEEKYRMLVENINDVLYVLDIHGDVTYISPAVERMTKYKVNEIIGKPFSSLIYPDDLPNLLDRFNRLVSGQLEPWGFRIMDKDGSIKYVRSSSRPIYEEGQIVGFTSLITDITERKLSEEKLVKSYESLKKTLNDAIETMVKIVEMRDPYTSGHQQRVSELATAIARQMKLEDTLIEQIRTAAVIHDIGKIHVPSEILSKPGKISDAEFSLIKTHPQGSYDIVIGMNFPGNVAQTVLQHHERLDGSGYPKGLKDEDTLLEAKILAVADVIEAMASHRPYRSALGIDKALEEISKNRGKLYEPDVVDACLELFVSGKFKFKFV
ncbi:MAG: PAS domain S-box protein [Dehalococcoidia bacterium]|nr:PAS domain S-box protein [Dehalococcoidia bacterium]